jgi:hypothetical protein
MKKERIDKAGTYLKNGYAFAVCSYRLSCFGGDGKPYPEPFPIPMRDVARAVQFIRHHAKELNIDPERIALTGGSAGGCAAVWVATHDDLADPASSDPVLRESSRVTCMFGRNTQTTLVPELWKTVIRWKESGKPARRYKNWVVGVPEGADPDSEQSLKLYIEASAYHHVTPDDPPLLLTYRNYDEVVGGDDEKDKVHSARHGLLIKQKYDELGLPCIVAQHGSDAGRSIPFLREHMR